MLPTGTYVRPQEVKMPVVTKVHKEASPDGTHQHIAQVCTEIGLHYTRAEVVAGLDRGETWKTWAAGATSPAEIRRLKFCPESGCVTSPYITTAPDHTTANNLDNLPPC
jgi:hypothetical protein